MNFKILTPTCVPVWNLSPVPSVYQILWPSQLMTCYQFPRSSVKWMTLRPVLLYGLICHRLSTHFAENVTKKHPIIKMVTNYNTCPKHCHLLDEGTADHHCSPGVCGANLPMHHTIGDEFTWAREGWLNFCEKMASRSVRSPLIQTVLLVVLPIPLQGRSAAK